MPWFRCNACGGEYQDPQPGGLRYFHACPPVPNPAYRSLEQEIENSLAGGAGAADPAAAENLRRDLHRTPEYVPRDGHRDENIVQEQHGKAHVKSEGAGRTELPD